MFFHNKSLGYKRNPLNKNFSVQRIAIAAILLCQGHSKSMFVLVKFIVVTVDVKPVVVEVLVQRAERKCSKTIESKSPSLQVSLSGQLLFVMIEFYRLIKALLICVWPWHTCQDIQIRNIVFKRFILIGNN